LEKVTIREETTGYPHFFHGHGKREKSLHRENKNRRQINAASRARFKRMNRIFIPAILKTTEEVKPLSLPN
jgi:hypothetical protein